MQPVRQKLLKMSFNHATHPFYPFVQSLPSAENRRSPVPSEIEW
jgi:MATE family multidrug resistance protein